MPRDRANPHFEPLDDWDAARARLGFPPRVPAYTAGHALESLAVFVRDHRMREVAAAGRSLEAHYGAFVFTQSRPGVEAARRSVRDVSYGSDPRVEDVNGHEARTYALGPEPPAGDPDPRMPAVVAWCDGASFQLVASDRLPVDTLLEIARSVS